MKNIERFSDRVANYVLYRPHYPPEIIPFLTENIGFDTKWVVADIGAGTGISSELFLQNGNTVFGVEPNKEMRAAAEKSFINEKNYISISATAEKTSLQDKSIDLILAGQAFHWFDTNKAKREFRRIATPGAFLLLVWNDRNGDSAIHRAYHQMLLEFSPAYTEVCQQNINEQTIGAFFSPHPYRMHSITHAQHFDFEGFKGRLLSSSYTSLEVNANYQAMLKRLAQIFDKFQVNGKIEFSYKCKLYFGKFT